ncbi:hypothetical protein [Kitasatospora sp. NPDC002040]|uniref:hypothetical protein n=1 Tax=Kitasatospora sp. NPDC002040 TaxID=3154661 RepID=UPI00331BD3B3
MAASREVSKNVRVLERALLARARGVGRPRRQHLRTHRRLVVAALRRAETALDTTGPADLTTLLLALCGLAVFSLVFRRQAAQVPDAVLARLTG